jgi:hypothetical protein
MTPARIAGVAALDTPEQQAVARKAATENVVNIESRIDTMESRVPLFFPGEIDVVIAYVSASHPRPRLIP